MFKLLIIGIIAAVVIGMFVVVRMFILNNTSGSKVGPEIINSGLGGDSQSARTTDLENKIEVLRKQVAALDSVVNKSSKTTTNTTSPNNASLQTRIENLESVVAQLQAKSGQTSTTSTNSSSTTTSSSKIPAYIFSLGSSGSTSELDWTEVTSPTVTINPADYPGASSFQVEGYLSSYQGNGTAYARLYNSNTGQAIAGSDFSTSSGDPGWISSQTFTLPSGKVTYSFQLKTTTGYAAILENARLKVNF
jgi:hypothetical protein